MTNSVLFTWKLCQKSIRTPRFFQLFIQGEFWRNIGAAFISREAILYEIQKVGDEFGQAAVQEKLLFFEKQGAFSFLLRQLAKKARTEKEVLALLYRHFASQQAQEYALQKARKLGYISDELMLEQLSQALFHKKKSVREAMMKLKTRFGKEVAPLLEEGAISLLDQDRKTLESLIQKKYMKFLMNRKEEPQEFQKCIQKLCRRGFSYDLVLQVLNDLGLKLMEKA